MHYKKNLSVVLFSGLCLGALGPSFAQTDAMTPGEVYDSNSVPVRSGTGDCVKTTRWNASMATMACDPDLVPKAAPVAAPTPTPAAPQMAPKVVEAPKPIAPVAPVVPEVLRKFDIPLGDALFAFGKSTLSKAGNGAMLKVVQDLKSSEKDFPKNYVIHVDAYTDRIGSAAANTKLSEARARTIKALFVKEGVSEDRISARGLGMADPVTGTTCDNLKPRTGANKKLVKCLQPDRRVEINVTGSKMMPMGK